jgi:sulfite exporter TauE/SafE
VDRSRKLQKGETCKPGRGPQWFYIALSVAILFLIGRVLAVTGLSTAAPATGGSVIELGAIFIVGLIAASSTCLAATGGLLLALSAQWSEGHPEASHWQKLRPLVFFNVGRILGYFVLGGIVGIIGKALIPSTAATGVFTVIIAIVMVILGLNILHFLPKRYCRIPVPNSWRMKIHRLTKSDHTLAPLLLGGLTFFLPCGFTQSMQLLALSSGSFFAGSLIMTAFALGTLPALLGISFASSFAGGKLGKMFFTFAGTASVLLGLLNLQSGLILTGIDPLGPVERLFTRTEASSEGVSIASDGQQVVTLQVTEYGYTPNHFTIQPGKSTWIYAYAPKNISNCASMLTVPSLNVSTSIKQGPNWLYVGSPTKSFLLTCSMGMFKATVDIATAAS